MLTPCSLADTLLLVIEIRKTDTYVQWLDGLRDIQARARVLARVERLATGNAGDVNPSVKVSPNCASIMVLATECIFTKRGRDLVLLLAGGDKSTQPADIKTALRLARNL